MMVVIIIKKKKKNELNVMLIKLNIPLKKMYLYNTCIKIIIHNKL